MESISERLALFALDNSKRTLTANADLQLGHGLAGAMLLDLIREGALSLQADGQLQPHPLRKLKQRHLVEAFAAIPSHAQLPQSAVYKALYGVMPHLKALVLEALVRRGIVKEDTSKLKWSIAFKAFTLKSNKKGYRKKLLNALRQDKLQLMDYWVLHLAHGCGLLVEGRKKLPTVVRRLNAYSAMIGLGEGLIPQLLDEIPATIVRAAKPLPVAAEEHVVWEWRAFWPESKGPTFNTSQAYKQSLENLSFEEGSDNYLLVEGVPENIKSRKGALEIKHPLESQEGYTAFAPKQILAFPLSYAQAADIFPRLLGQDANPRFIDDIDALQSLLQGNGYRARMVEVKKKRFLAKLKNQVRVEFCSLSLDGRKFVSACVEGPDAAITQAHALNFQTPDAQVMGYVEFMKSTVMETA